MEDLNKNQIVLLTILISFVTSIATGIMTTSLLMEAPVEVTQTINRVVEKTIETVTPAPTEDGSKKDVKKEVVTVVVNEEDRVIDSIDKNTKSIVRIRATNKELGIDNFYGLGIVVSKEGVIATDKKLVSEVMDYVAITSDGVSIPLAYIKTSNKDNAGFFLAKPKDKYNFVPVTLSGSVPKLGQSVVSIGGDRVNAVLTGRITTINTKEVSSTTPKVITSIETDISPVDSVYGAPILSLSGEILGLNLSDFNSTKIYIPASIIREELAKIKIVE